MKIYVLTFLFVIILEITLSSVDRYQVNTYIFIIFNIITNKKVCENRYNELKEILPKYSWISVKEYTENENYELIEGEVLHYNDI